MIKKRGQERFMKNFDLKNQVFPGQETPAENYSIELPDGIQNTKKLPPWFQRDFNLSKKDREIIRKYLDGLTDDKIIEIYYQMRDKKGPWDGGYFYPNIQILHGTPFEREKDRREQRIWSEKYGQENEIVEWYKEAKERSCVWWLENHIIARHALSASGCMSCGACTALCPAAEFFDYNPRIIMETVQEKNEDEIIKLLKADTIWYCFQCGSCKPKCPRENNPFGMISSLRQLSQIKGYHVYSVRGRQQYAARHLWGGNLWNRAFTLYFRDLAVEPHRDFGPRHEIIFNHKEEYFRRVGASPDMDGSLSSRKVHPKTLYEVRRLWEAGGGLYMWEVIEDAAKKQADELDITIDEYHDKVKTEG